MKVIISGASGLVGSALVRRLEAKGDQVFRLVRRKKRSEQEIEWGGDGVGFPAGFTCDAVVHLAGENIMGIWTAKKKRFIQNSRVGGTRIISEAIARLEQKPPVLISASAVGYYGEGGDEILDEDSGPGEGFLPLTCVKWEAATAAAREAGIRVVNVRIGLVITRRGGMLASMLPAFRFGLGSRFGSGKHWMSWIALDDLLALIEFAIANPNICGSLNATAPNPVTNAEFTSTLARALHRPTFLPIPAFLLRLAPGNMGREALLASERVVPKKALEVGFQFAFPTLESVLENELATSAPKA